MQSSVPISPTRQAANAVVVQSQPGQATNVDATAGRLPQIAADVRMMLQAEIQIANNLIRKPCKGADNISAVGLAVREMTWWECKQTLQAASGIDGGFLLTDLTEQGWDLVYDQKQA